MSEQGAAEINGVYYETLQQAIAAVKDGETINVSSGTHVATANDKMRIDVPNVTIQGTGDTTIIDTKTYVCSDQGGFLVAADNVTLRNIKVINSSTNGNISAIKFVQRTRPLASGKVENVIVSSQKGHGLNIHGVDNMVISGIKVENAGKCGVSLANSKTVSISNISTEGLTSLWGDISIMYKATDMYASRATVMISGVNTFGTGLVYSERPTTALGGQDTIQGLAGTDGWVKNQSESIIMYNKGSVVANNGTTGEGYASIEAALSDAKSGDTIYINSGIYNTTGITIPASVTLTSKTGNAQDVTIIGTKGANTVTLTSKSKIKSITVTRDNSVDWNTNPVTQGISVTQQSVGATIEKCIIKETRNGIYANNTNVIIKNCIIKDNYTGIHLVNNVSGMIDGNIIENNKTVGLLTGATNLISENGFKNLIISTNKFDSNWYAQVQNQVDIFAPIDINTNTFTQPVLLVKADSAGEPSYENWDENNNPNSTISNRLVFKTDGNIIYDANTPPTSNNISKVENITSQLPPVKDIDLATETEKEVLVEQVKQVVEIIQAMPDTEKQQISSETVSALEELLIKANSNVNETQIYINSSLSSVISGSVKAVGASLSVPSSSNKVQNAQIKIEPTSSPTLPTNIEKAVSMDIHLNILDNVGSNVYTNIQPVVPITISVPIPVGIDKENIIILHYHDNEQTPETITPKVNKTENTLNFKVSKFSTFVFANVKSENGSNSSSGSEYTNYTIKISQEGNGTVYPNFNGNNIATVAKNSNLTFKFTPDEGYFIGDVLVDSKSIGAKLSYEFLNITSDHTLKVIFTKNEGQLTFESKFSDVKQSDWFFENVKKAVENGWLIGVSDKEFGPINPMTRAMLWTTLARFDGQDTTSGANWYEQAQNWTIKNSISDGSNPNGNITREQIVTILYRYAKQKGYEVTQDGSMGLSGYTDSNQISSYATTSMHWAVTSGIIQGYRDTISPTKQATRAEVATIMIRFIEVMQKQDAIK